MNKIFLTLIILAVSLQNNHAQTEQDEKVFKQVNPPNFLVHNQLSPEILKLEYAGGISAGSFKNPAGEELYRFNQNTLTVSGYPITLINKRQQQLYIGFGYVKNTYSSFDTETPPKLLQNTFHSVNLNIFLNTRIKGKFYWFSYLQAGVSGSKPFEEFSSSYNEIFLNKINYKIRRDMNVGLGVAYISNLGEPLIVPSLAFVYSRQHYLINIDFPIKAELEGILGRGKWRPVAGVSFPATTYYVKNVDQYFSTSGLTGYMGMRYRVFDLLYLYAGWQAGLGETFKVGSRTDRTEVGTFNAQSRYVVSMNVQIARFIPLLEH